MLGVPVDVVTGAEAVALLWTFLRGEGGHHVMTPNNEMCVMALRDVEFAAVMRRTALNLPDSTGVVWAMRRAGAPDQRRVTGVDTVTALCASLDENMPVFFLGAAPGVAEAAAAKCQISSAKFQVAGCFAGSPKEEDAADIIKMINESGARLLLVAYGAPAQDFWIDRHLKDMPGIRVAMGVGGTFDFLAGLAQRAPLWMRRCGLEWAWRFAQEPARWKRMWNAVAVFPVLVLRYGK